MLIEGVRMMVRSGRGEGCVETPSGEGQESSLRETLSEGRQVSANALPCNYCTVFIPVIRPHRNYVLVPVIII